MSAPTSVKAGPIARHVAACIRSGQDSSYAGITHMLMLDSHRIFGVGRINATASAMVARDEQVGLVGRLAYCRPAQGMAKQASYGLSDLEYSETF